MESPKVGPAEPRGVLSAAGFDAWTHADTTQFGWEGDGGLGERMIGLILAGAKTATCAPRFSYSPQDLQAVFATKGRVITVIDVQKRPRCRILIRDVFETTFGNPDPRLVEGEGCGSDAKRFQQSHLKIWKEWLEKIGQVVTDDTMLVVEEFQRVKD